jgi:hypothetical protein
MSGILTFFRIFLFAILPTSGMQGELKRSGCWTTCYADSPVVLHSFFTQSKISENSIVFSLVPESLSFPCKEPLQHHRPSQGPAHIEKKISKEHICVKVIWSYEGMKFTNVFIQGNINYLECRIQLDRQVIHDQ